MYFFHTARRQPDTIGFECGLYLAIMVLSSLLNPRDQIQVPKNLSSSFGYCHTLLNKSSLPPTPPVGLELAAPLVPAVVVQPPNSSSEATLGVGLNPPLAPGTMLVVARELPVLPHPKSLAAALEASGLFVAAVAVVSVLQALPPQTSELELAQFALEEAIGFAAGAGVGAEGLGGLERLNTELAGAIDGGWLGAGAGGAGWAGVEKSKRSPSAADAGTAAGFGAAAVVVAVEKAPNPLEPNEGFCW